MSWTWAFFMVCGACLGGTRFTGRLAPYLAMCWILADSYWRYEKGETVKLGSEFPADHLWGINGDFRCHDVGTMDVTNNPKTRLINDDFTLSYRGSFAVPREIQCDMNLLNWTGQRSVGGRAFDRLLCVIYGLI